MSFKPEFQNLRVHRDWNLFVLRDKNSAPVLPDCFRQVVMIKQNQSFGGTPVGNGFPQSGPAVTARADFLNDLGPYVTDNLNGVVASPTVYYQPGNPLSLWSGAGTLVSTANPDIVGPPDPAFDYDVTVRNNPGNGRFNTSANTLGNWLECNYGFIITFSEQKTAFTCYVMDLGDACSAEGEFRFSLGGVMQNIITMPLVNVIEKPSSDQAMCVAFKNGNKPFDTVEFVGFQFVNSASDWDYIGVDDLAVGDVVACTAANEPTVFYGANTVGDPAKTVTGAAKTARDAFVSALGNSAVCDFESMPIGSVSAAGVPVVIGFSGDISGVLTGTTIYSQVYTGTSSFPAHIPFASTVDAISNSAVSTRWNTTTAGSKFYEWTDEVIITLAEPMKSVGFYMTDLGDNNASLRITLYQAGDDFGVSYYIDKAATMFSPAALLRFWGVVDEQPFVKVIIRTMYYVDTVPYKFGSPAQVTGLPVDMVGLDDLIFGN